MEVLSAVLFFTAVAVYMLWFSRLSRTLTGPRVWPLLGSLPGLVRNCHRMHDWILENLRACGGTYQTTTFAVPLIARKAALTTVTCDPRNLEHILKSRFDNYPKGPTWHAVFHDLLGDGIFNSDGDTWLFQRKTAALEFTTRTLRQAMSRWVTRAIHGRLLPIMQEASKRCGGGGGGEEEGGIDLQDLLLRLTFDNICGLAFGKDPETLAKGLPENAFASAFDRATEASLHRFILPAFMWKMKKWLKLGMEVTLADSVSHVEEYLSGVINARKHELAAREQQQQQLEGSLFPSSHPKQQQHDDLLSRFMKKGSYEDTFLQHVALNFILAGRDTSSVALSWFFWLMTIHKDVEQKILYEICTVLADTRGDDDPGSWVAEPLSYDEADRLVYLKAALSETLRLYPSVPEDSKHVVADDILPDGTFVPAGSAITYSIYSAGRMKSIWGDNCLDFYPDRWLSPDGTRFLPMDQFKFVAFNAGPRICLGKDLAYLQMKSIAAAVLLRHRLEVAPGHRVEQKMSLTLFMKYGLRVNVYRRDLSGVAERVKAARSAAAGGGVVEERKKPVGGSDDALAVGVNGGTQKLVGVGGAGVMVASVA